MKRHFEKFIKVTLELDEEEAQWLKSITQNPLTVHESTKDAEIRRKFWNALSDIKDI